MTVGADLSRPSPQCVECGFIQHVHKRGCRTLSGGQVMRIYPARTWDPAWGAGNNAFQVPIYRLLATPPHFRVILLISIIGPYCRVPRTCWINPHYLSPGQGP